MSEDHIRVVGQVDEHGPRHVGLTDPVRPLAEGVRQQINVHPSDYWPLEPPLMVTRAERVWMQEVADRYEQVQRGGASALTAAASPSRHALSVIWPDVAAKPPTGFSDGFTCTIPCSNRRV